jgi:hypothetical protein
MNGKTFTIKIFLLLIPILHSNCALIFNEPQRHKDTKNVALVVYKESNQIHNAQFQNQDGIIGLASIEMSGASPDTKKFFHYPSPEEEETNFHDLQPIWHPKKIVLAFTRVYLGEGGQSIFCYAPASPGRDTVSLTPTALRTAKKVSQPGHESEDFPYLPQRQEKVYSSEFAWIPTEVKTKFSFLYEQSGVIYKGELTIEEPKATIVSSPFIDLGKYSVIHLDCSPGQTVAYTTEKTGMIDLYTKPVSDANPASQERPLVGTADTEECAPKWSHDGKYIVYYANHQPEGQRISLDLFLKDATSPDKEVIHLTDSDLDESLPTFSPKDDFVAFYTARREETESGEGKLIYDLWVVRLTEDKNKASAPVLIAEDVYRQERGPSWISGVQKTDGQYLIYTVGTRDKVMVTNVEKEKPQSKKLEGLAGYENNRLLIGDLDCRGYEGFDELYLAYSARIPSGERRIYVENLLYRDEISPFSIELSIKEDMGEIRQQLWEKGNVKLGEGLKIQQETDEKRFLIDHDKEQIFIISIDGPKYKVTNSWYVKELAIPSKEQTE